MLGLLRSQLFGGGDSDRSAYLSEMRTRYLVAFRTSSACRGPGWRWGGQAEGAFVNRNAFSTLLSLEITGDGWKGSFLGGEDWSGNTSKGS